jgi:hypothetical protein
MSEIVLPLNWGDSSKSVLRLFCISIVNWRTKDETLVEYDGFSDPNDPATRKPGVWLNPTGPNQGGTVLFEVRSRFDLYTSKGHLAYQGACVHHVTFKYDFDDNYTDDKGNHIADQNHLILDEPTVTEDAIGSNAVEIVITAGFRDMRTPGSKYVWIGISANLPTSSDYTESSKTLTYQVGWSVVVSSSDSFTWSRAHGHYVNLPPVEHRLGAFQLPLFVHVKKFPPPPLPDALYGLALYDISGFQEDKGNVNLIVDQIKQWKASLERFEAKHPDLPKLTEGLTRKKITVNVKGYASATGEQSPDGRTHNVEKAKERAANVKKYVQDLLQIPEDKVVAGSTGYDGPPPAADKKGRITPDARDRHVEISLDTDELEKYMRGK